MTLIADAGTSGATDGVAEVVRAAQAGDTMALAELVNLLAPYVGRICGPIALADGADAAQEALIAVLGGIGQLREPAALFAWARAIAAREAVRVARKARRCEVAYLDELPERGDPELAVDVADVLGRLSPEHRAVLVLRDLEGLDEQAASELLGVPVGTTKSRLHRARGRFKEEWQR